MSGVASALLGLSASHCARQRVKLNCNDGRRLRLANVKTDRCELWDRVGKIQRPWNNSRPGITTVRAHLHIPGTAHALPFTETGIASMRYISTVVSQIAIFGAAVICGISLTPYAGEFFGLDPQEEEEPYLLEGVDVSLYPIMQHPDLARAARFAAKWHAGQVRKTGEPYVLHCVHTARIIAALLPSEDKALETVIAGMLHDVVDDTECTLEDVCAEFGEGVAKLVDGVTKLSHVNQLLRRHNTVMQTPTEKAALEACMLSTDVHSLRVMILSMVDDPRVLLIKLADRLHNMRSIFVLRPDKARAVSFETLAMWCSLASRLGLWVVKAELEDLCFAVLLPDTYERLMEQRSALWRRAAVEDAVYQHPSRSAPRRRRNPPAATKRQHPFTGTQLDVRVPEKIRVLDSRDDDEGAVAVASSTRRASAAVLLEDPPVPVAPSSSKADTEAGPGVATNGGSGASTNGRRQAGNGRANGLSGGGSGGRESGYPSAGPGREVSEDDADGGSKGSRDGGGTVATSFSIKQLRKWEAACAPTGDLSHLKLSPEQKRLQSLLESVLPFELLTDRAAWLRASAAQALSRERSGPLSHRLVTLAALGACESSLTNEVWITSPYVAGMEVTLMARVKSLYSAHKKMKRKGVGLDKVYDARALRVVVGDAGGEMHADAVEGCYRLLGVVHNLWWPVYGEYDDYIVNPKPSGYQSLHTAVLGPGGAPLEVQIRTRSMHNYAEYGSAAHWVYKESYVEPGEASSLVTCYANSTVMACPDTWAQVGASPAMAAAALEASIIAEDGGRAVEGDSLDPLDDEFVTLRVPDVQVGQPVLRVHEGKLRDGVVVRIDRGGRDVVAAVNFGVVSKGHGELASAGGAAQQSRPLKLYADLLRKATMSHWSSAGQGDLSVRLESYTLCPDGFYHREDQYGHKLPVYIQLLDVSAEHQATIHREASQPPEPKSAHRSGAEGGEGEASSSGGVSSRYAGLFPGKHECILAGGASGRDARSSSDATAVEDVGAGTTATANQAGAERDGSGSASGVGGGGQGPAASSSALGNAAMDTIAATGELVTSKVRWLRSLLDREMTTTGPKDARSDGDASEDDRTGGASAMPGPMPDVRVVVMPNSQIVPLRRGSTVEDLFTAKEVQSMLSQRLLLEQGQGWGQQGWGGGGSAWGDADGGAAERLRQTRQWVVRVNYQEVPLSRQLSDGDLIEILQAPATLNE
eukprot:jgi/Mesvir1/20330/Mv19921-RA.1